MHPFRSISSSKATTSSKQGFLSANQPRTEDSLTTLGIRCTIKIIATVISTQGVWASMLPITVGPIKAIKDLANGDRPIIGAVIITTGAIITNLVSQAREVWEA
jgi:hypothetical protein